MPFHSRSTPSRAALVATLLVAVAMLTSCLHSGDPATPSPSPRATAPPRPTAQSPSPTDHHLTNLEFRFCLETDKVVRREAPLLTPPISAKLAKRRLSQAQFIAEAQADAFAKAGYMDFARQMQNWADGFATGKRMIDQGARPVDALHPAVHQVSILFREIDCEGDR